MHARPQYNMPAIRSFFTDLFRKKQPEVPPPITTNAAVSLLILYTLIYVVPFYLSSRTRPSPTLSRDAPSVIRARITSVSLSCFVCSVTTLWVLCRVAKGTAYDAAHTMGYWPAGLAETATSLLLTAMLFLGPLFEYLVIEAGWRDWVSLAPVKELFNEWTTWRNIVAGPVTEEVLFRSAAVPLMLIARTSVLKTIFLSPLIFGLAHVHHFYEFRITHPRVPLAAAILRSLFQLAYTSLFGAYATFLFLRTGSLAAICVVHAFCNCMGLPRVWGRVERVVGNAKETSGEQKGSVLWTAAYYILLVTGAILFYRNLWTLTESSNGLITVQ